MPHKFTFPNVRVRGVTRLEGPVVAPGLQTTDIKGVLAAGGANAIIGAGTTSYLTFAHMGGSIVSQGPSFSVFEPNRQIIMPVAGKLKNFMVRTNSEQPGDGDLVLTVRINGMDTGIVITIPAGAPAGVFSNLEIEAMVEPGDLVSFSGANGSASASSAALNQWSICLL